MNLKKRNIIIILIIITINIFIYINNRQKTSFRYFIWDIQRVSLGEIINISFFSGFLISTTLNKYLINKTINNQAPNNLEEEDYENTTKTNSKLDYQIPPERDIRDTQPTISVNYRVVKSNEDKDFKYADNSYEKDKNDDWDETNYEW